MLDPVYKQWSIEGRFVHPQKSRCSTLLQKRLEVDTIVQTRKHHSHCLEEKIVRWPRSGIPFDRFFLETESCTNEGYVSEGWMRYAEADALLYAFVQEGDRELDAYLIVNFSQLKSWFWGVYQNYYEFTMDTFIRTRGRLVDIVDVVQAVKTERFRISENGIYQKVPCPVKEVVPA